MSGRDITLYRVLLLVALFILHGSLYPWRFSPPPLGGGPLEVLLHSWPAQLDRYLLRDVAANLALYMPLGLVAYLALRENWGRRRGLAGSLLLALMLSSTVEVVQLFVPGRTSSLSDILLNIAGAALGCGLALGFEDRIQALRAVSDPLLHAAPSGAAVLLSSWLFYQLFPFFPDLSTTHLMGKLVRFTSGESWSILRAFTIFCQWLAVEKVVESTVPARRARTACRALLLVFPIRLFVAGRTVMGSELAGAALALLPTSRLHSREAARGHLIACLLALAFILECFLPAHHEPTILGAAWGAAASEAWEYRATVLLERGFMVGTLLWLLWPAGRPSNLVSPIIESISERASDIAVSRTQ